MNNLETNALRIAELMNPLTKGNCPNLHKLNLFGISKRYRTYEGLMPIVFECNKSKDFYYSRIYINPQGYDTISIFNYCDSQELSDLVANFDYNRESEPEFIEALQLAVIKYLELKSNGQIKT